MFNHIERGLLASLGQLSQQSSIEVIDELRGEINQPFSELLPLTDFERDWRDVSLDFDTLEESSRLDEIGVYWQTKPPLPQFFGEYRIPSPYEVLAQGTQDTGGMGIQRVQRDFLRQLRYIDHAWQSGSGSTTWIRMSPNTSPLEIWQHDLTMTGGTPYPHGYVQLDITYRKYIETLILTKGTRGWQYLFADVPFRDSPIAEIAENVTHMLQVFPDLFPEHDYSELQQRWEARR
ncbi:hypothetical protein [Streptomyces phaeochromogenes]|uniref:hypothetical protein n=1 Tax=Streptomyces phaeochromogenes TaxID=1923 RepID=UPI0033E7D45D